MKRVGLIGVVMALLLVISATPVMADEVENVTLDPNGLYLYNFEFVQTAPATLKFYGYFNNTNLTHTLTGTVYLYTNASSSWLIEDVNKTVTVANNTTEYRVELFSYTFSAPGVYNVSVGNKTTSDNFWLPNQTVNIYVLNEDEGPISNDTMGINMLKLSDDKVKVGDILTISAEWDFFAKENGTRRIVVVAYADYKDIKDLTKTEIDVAKLLDKSKRTIALPEEGGSGSWEFSPAEPGYYVVVAFLNKTIFNDSLVFLAESPVAGKPTVSISVDRSVVAIGDAVKVKASMSTDVPAERVQIFITGAGVYINQTAEVYYTPSFICNKIGSFYTVKEACEADEWWIQIPAGAPEGTYVAKIDVNPHRPTRAEATALFQIVKPEITSLTVPSQHVKGRDLVIEGVTNLAKSGTKADNPNEAVENYAYLTIKDLAGNVIVDPNMAVGQAYIDDGGKFRFKIDNFGRNAPPLNRDLPTGYYKVTVSIVSITSGTLTDEETAIMEIVKPEIKLIADKNSVTRGDTVTFTIDTNLKVNNPVNFTIEDIDFCTGDPDCVAEKQYKVDVKGDVVIKLDVHTMAPLKDYKFTAKIVDLGLSDEVRVTVVKQTLNIAAETNVVVRGGDVRFTGSTTAEVVYVYANEPGVFRIGNKDVAELPSDTVLRGAQLTTATVYPDSNDNLDFKVDVLVQTAEYGDVTPGTYYLYFYAPANVTGGEANEIDRASDPQAIVAITVIDPKIEMVDIPSRIPYQGEVEVNILTAPGDKDNVEVSFTLEGSNVKVRPGDFGISAKQKPNAENWVNFTLDLKEYAVRKGSTLEPGLYIFTVKLSFVSTLGGDEVDSKEVLVEIVPQTLDVTIEPSTPVVGDKITVSVSTNRAGVSGYEHIWVTMVGVNYKAVQKVTLNSEGKGSVTFETVGIAPGTYKFYVRDTAGTVKEKTEVQLVEDLYNLDPADILAKLYNAHDDLLVIKTIQILETAPTTPAPTTPAPTTPAPTTPAPTTPTPTTPAPTTPAPTTPAQQPGGVPGFEAVFAIAGLLAVAYLLRRK